MITIFRFPHITAWQDVRKSETSDHDGPETLMFPLSHYVLISVLADKMRRICLQNAIYTTFRAWQQVTKHASDTNKWFKKVNTNIVAIRCQFGTCVVNIHYSDCSFRNERVVKTIITRLIQKEFYSRAGLNKHVTSIVFGSLFRYWWRSLLGVTLCCI